MDNKFSNRRGFLKGLAMAAGASLLPGQLLAQDAKTTDTLDFFEMSHNVMLVGNVQSIRVLTANILLASSAHKGTPFEWEPRKEYLVKVLKAQKADIICTQEVLGEQFDYLVQQFADYQGFGFAGPEMDARPGDYQGVTKNVIFFRKDRFDLVSAGGYWLSETPLIGASQSWDAARGRHANWVRLKERTSGRQFRVLDAHLDHKGQKAREEQVKIIMVEAAQYAKSFPQILAGDFNADMRNPAYKEVIDAGWRDTYLAAHKEDNPGNTFHKMQGSAYKTKTGKIDFIFCRGDVIPTASEIVKDSENGQYPSDHYFVRADLTL